MKQETVIEDLGREQFPEKARELCGLGYRLVQMMGTPRKESVEVLVSFDKGYELKNFRIQVPRSDFKLPSITGATLAAFSYENELQDLFGIEIEGLAINYGGNFLRTRKVHPLADMVDPGASTKKPSK
jgi:ech hydrogenase subunit D